VSKKLFISLLLTAGLAGGLAADPAATGTTADWTQAIKAAAQDQRKGDLKGAEKLLLRALLVTEGFDDKDPRAAYTLDYLGTLYTQSGRTDDAIAVFERALAGFDRALGPHSEDALASAGRLADSYENAKQWSKAETLRRRLLAEVKAQPSPDLAALAQAESDLALCLDAQKQWDEAMSLYSDALQKRRQALGPNAPEVAETLSNQGRIWLLKGDFRKAEALMRQALAIDQQALGANDPAVADDLHRLAVVLKKAGKTGEAAADEAEALSIQNAQPAEAPAPTVRTLPKISGAERDDAADGAGGDQP
jgi:tetratricopeptide (TPR) repeat protein